MDTNKDRLVSLSEFMAATKREEFQDKDEWEVRASVSNVAQTNDGELATSSPHIVSYYSLSPLLIAPTDFGPEAHVHRGGAESV